MLGYFFFFQAEDGIRDIGVTGVQTCALPILTPFFAVHLAAGLGAAAAAAVLVAHPRMLRPGFSWARWRPLLATTRSEGRRGGEEWRSRWSPYPLKKKLR